MVAVETGIKDRIQAAMKAAMKAREKKKLGAIRLILAAIKQREVDERVSLDDDQVISILDKMVKQRRESVTQYRAAQRDDLAENEEYEIEVIQEYLPQPLTDNEIATMIDVAVEESGAASIRDMGKVMGLLKPRMQGRVDMACVSKEVKNCLSRK